MRVRDLPHLVRRFFRSTAARWPSPEEQIFVGHQLTDRAAVLFFAQQPMDQAHAIRVARRVATRTPERRDLIRAALLHDIGKAATRLGVLRRSVASLLAIVHLPRPRAMQQYLDHGTIGADLLTGIEADPVVIAFAAHHHQGVPAGVDPGDWAILCDADHE